MAHKHFQKVDSILLKGIIVTVLTLLMLIPIKMVMSLIDERSKIQTEVTDEIVSKWGGTQTIVGPVLVVPINTANPKESVYKKNKEYLYLLPNTYNTTTKANVEERSRSIYNTLVYQSENQIQGDFDLSKIKDSKTESQDIIWDEAFMILGINNLQGIKNKIVLKVNGQDYEASPGITHNTIIKSGLTVNIPIDSSKTSDLLDFKFDLHLNGSQKLHISTIGKENKIKVKSNWNTVSFSGDFLPSRRDITSEGLDAEWNIFDYNRNYVQSWIGNNTYTLPEVGIDLRYSVDQYQMSTRSVKYAILFIALTFVIFFFVEIITKRKIHPVQYALVSLALILFYTLLIALSEHISFHIAYLASSIAIVLMIALYAKSIFHKWTYALAMGAFVAVTYIYLYVILQLEDLALLIGAIGLFIALGGIMYASRKIDWYKTNEDSEKTSKNVDL